MQFPVESKLRRVTLVALFNLKASIIEATMLKVDIQLVDIIVPSGCRSVEYEARRYYYLVTG